MTMSDPIADMLTRIRNANTAKHDTVDVPSSKMKLAIADILVNEGYIAKYDMVEDGGFQTIRITLKYGKDKNEKIISGIKRISKPGLRVYANKEELPRVLGGLGIAILSTNQGVITDKEARRLGVGGEVLAFVWSGNFDSTKLVKNLAKCCEVLSHVSAHMTGAKCSMQLKTERPQRSLREFK